MWYVPADLNEGYFQVKGSKQDAIVKEQEKLLADIYSELIDPQSFYGTFEEALDKYEKKKAEIEASENAGKTPSPADYKELTKYLRGIVQGGSDWKEKLLKHFGSDASKPENKAILDKLDALKAALLACEKCVTENLSATPPKTGGGGPMSFEDWEVNLAKCVYPDAKEVIDEVMDEFSKNITFDLTLGETPQKPGFNANNTVPEDFIFSDSPEKPIKNESIFKFSSEKLKDIFNNMVEYVSAGELENIAKQMVERFYVGAGGYFKDNNLNEEVKANPNFVTYHNKFLANFQSIAKNTPINKLAGFKPMNISRFSFPTIGEDLLKGMVIIMHQVWAIKISLKDVKLNYKSNTGNAKLVYTLYDHFGLDWEDVIKFGNYPIAGDGFKAWYILQHYRNAKPFITEVVIEYPMNFIFP